MNHIKKIKLKNFKKYTEFETTFDPKINILIGDNESGKSTILQAIDIVLSGSRQKIEKVGLDNLFNTTCIQKFLTGQQKIENLPELSIELYFNDVEDILVNGKNNSDKIVRDGISLICEPDIKLHKEIKEIFDQNEDNFPFEFYSISFRTFAGEGYSGYKKYLKHIFLDNTQISNEYANREYVKTMYFSKSTDVDRSKRKNLFRKSKIDFRKNSLKELNDKISAYSFSLRTGSKSNLESGLTITENDISIENQGKGKQCFIKTEFALDKKENTLELILLEEPENHLSHLNMKRLIRRIAGSDDKQIIIATHNDLICARLDLRKCILLNSSDNKKCKLESIPEKTAKFFIKAPNNNLLQFILSKKVILVEGDAEFILMEEFYKSIAKETPEKSDVHIISVGGTSFKRYLNIARVLQIKTAVIRDNDKDFKNKVTENYIEYIEDFISIFSDSNNKRYTFEVAFYEDNKSKCDEIFGPDRRSLSVQEYMLNEKAEVAYQILENGIKDFSVPEYISNAIKWIKN